MNKVENNFGQNLYTFTTPSGLKVLGVHKPGFKKSLAIYGTPFGALNLKQSMNGEIIEHKSGLAHFLEHKLFEDESSDVLTQFSDLGANGNAFTSYDQTMYYFSHNGDIEKPLLLLLDFVSKFGVSEESVEKEKGIIIEEIKMYEQMPHMKLLNETYRNLFHTYPFIYDIAGTPESVSATTREDLQKAYEMNYVDSRMILVIVSPEDPETVESLVLKGTSNHHYVESKVEDIFDDEPASVVHEYRVIEENIEASKMSVSYKIPYHGKHKQKDEFLLSLLIELNFTELNPQYQSWLDANIISNTFDYGVDFRDAFAMITFFNEGDNIEGFKKLIEETMENLNTDPHKFKLLSRRNYGEMIGSLENPEELGTVMARSSLDGMDYFDYLEMVKGLKYEDLLESLKLLNDKVSTTLFLKKK